MTPDAHKWLESLPLMNNLYFKTHARECLKMQKINKFYFFLGDSNSSQCQAASFHFYILYTYSNHS